MTESLKSFLAGWAGGVGILAVGHPFDTVKTMMQNAPEGQYKNAMDCVKQITKKEGPMALYKGVQAPLAGVGTVFAIYFLAYESCERVLRSQLGRSASYNLTLPEVMICGGSTGVAGSLILGPSELLKVRQQTAVQNGKEGSFGAVIRDIRATEGMKGFTRGLGATMFRDVPGSMAWFGAFEMTKQALCEDPKKPGVMQALVAGGMGGIGMWSFAIPLDAVKTRVQAGAAEASFAAAARAIHREKGFGGFYRGIGPALLRAFPANAACFASKEKTKAFLDSQF
jgi:solute carrier family 25 carnitine/acylcarnitine transporter 20/29